MSGRLGEQCDELVFFCTYFRSTATTHAEESLGAWISSLAVFLWEGRPEIDAWTV
jgi:hypothetical protein